MYDIVCCLHVWKWYYFEDTNKDSFPFSSERVSENLRNYGEIFEKVGKLIDRRGTEVIALIYSGILSTGHKALGLPTLMRCFKEVIR